MPIKFGGQFEIQRTREEVYDFLTDPKKFAPLLPGFQGMTQQDDTHFTVKVNVGASSMAGSADMKMELSQAERPRRAEYKGRGSAAGGRVAMTAGFDLTPVDAGTSVEWQGEAEVSGILVLLAGGMIEPLGKKNVQKLIEGLQSALS